MASQLDRGSRLSRLALGASALITAGLAFWHAPDLLGSNVMLALPLLVVGVMALGGLVLRGMLNPQRVLWVLCADVIMVGLLAAMLPDSLREERVAFAAGYLVSTLVAAVGRRRGAAFAGAAAGVMVSLLGAAQMLQAGNVATLSVAIAGVRLVVIVLAAVEVAWVSEVLQVEAARRATQELVQRELQQRDAEAAEMLLFAQALAQSEGPNEVMETMLKHLRRHFDVQAHALALESDGEVVAVWEERGRLENEHLSERRERLQQALTQAGHNGVINRITPRSLEARSTSVDVSSATWIAVPLKGQGAVVGVLVLSDPRRDAVPPQRIGALADLARRSSEALARISRTRSEETRRTAMLLRQMREGVLLLGPDGQALLANPAARDALGLGREDASLPERLGDVSLAELSRTPPGVARHFRVQIARGDELRPLELGCTAVGIVEGKKRVGTLVTLRDVTEEEMARRRLVQAEKMTLVGQTLAGVAHELNNPLAALVGYADLLKQDGVPEHLQRPIQQMREQAMRATRIVRNLLNFARRRNPQRTTVNVADLIHGTVELFAYEARMNEVTVDVSLDPALPTLLADPHALQQVFVNLVQNGIHALATSPRTPRRISIRGQASGDQLVVTVSDNGPGVPPAIAARIFEPFFTTKAAGHGTGLGLALSRAVAKEHGGDLGLEPERAEGACFVLRLPLRQASAAPAPSEGEAEGRLPTSVLVVDDEAAVRETLVGQIGTLGIKVESAGDIAEAQRMIARSGYEALLVDVRMPGGSGTDLHKALAARDPSLGRRIVFMTGDIVNDDVLSSLRRIGNPFLEKPFTMSELRSALSSVVRGAEAEGGDLPRWPSTSTTTR
ncbi:MAG: ATP-binding protein [Planctomycetia bacterium]